MLPHPINTGMPKEADYHRFLGVSTTASDQEIDRAYLRLSMSCHPDNIPSVVSDEVRKVTNFRFIALAEVKTALQNRNRT